MDETTTTRMEDAVGKQNMSTAKDNEGDKPATCATTSSNDHHDHQVGADDELDAAIQTCQSNKLKTPFEKHFEESKGSPKQQQVENMETTSTAKPGAHAESPATAPKNDGVNNAKSTPRHPSSATHQM